MRRTPIVLALVAAAAFTPNASAQDDVVPQLRVSPNVLGIWQLLEVWYDERSCPGGLDGPITSPGFYGSINTNGSEAWSVGEPGTYTVTMKCVGSPKIGSAEFTLVERVAATFRIIPEKPAPGGTFQAEVDPVACPDGPFVFQSDGFRDANRPNLLEGVVVDTPGSYSVIVQCWLGRNLIKGGGMLEVG